VGQGRTFNITHKKHYQTDNLVWEPRTTEAKERCLRMYDDAVRNPMKLRDLAQKYDVSYEHASKMVKWAVTTGRADSGLMKEVINKRIFDGIEDLEKDALARAKRTLDPKKLYRKVLEEINKLEKMEEPNIEDAMAGLYAVREYIRANTTGDIMQEIAVRGEIRQSLKMMGQVENILGDGEKNAGRPIIINMPNINRGQGVENAVEIEGAVVGENKET